MDGWDDLFRGPAVVFSSDLLDGAGFGIDADSNYCGNSGDD